MAQQEAEPLDETPEVVTWDGKDGIFGIALVVPEVVAVDPVLGFEMAPGR
jgi:hypothetical protein